jgi:nucleoside phosphorylase
VSVTGIVAALTAEARTLGPALQTIPGGGARSCDLQMLPGGDLLATSGMGPEAAARAALALVAAGARNLLSFGLVGALDPQLAAGTVLLAEAVIDGCGTAYPTSHPWRERLALRAASRGIAGGSLLSVGQPLSTPAAKAQARERTGACAVDMESFAIGGIAVQQGLNFAVARVVIDTALDTVPRSIQQATGPRGQVSCARLTWGLIRAPADIPALLQLSRRYRLAMGSLRYLGQRVVGSP